MEQSSLYYDARPAGDGKTYEQLERITRLPGLYLFVVDRVELMDERISTLERMAQEQGVRIHTSAIYSISPARPGGVPSVRVALEALPNTYTNGHVAIFVTHAAIKEANLWGFGDWNLIIDETPNWWDRCKLRTSVSATLLPELFDIEEGDVAHQLVPRRRLNRRELHLDSLAAPLATLHARASNSNNLVVTHLRCWSELATNPTWTWWALWSPRQLSVFRSATILAAGYDRSLTYQMAAAVAPEMNWAPLVSAGACRPSMPRSLTIRYFAEGHTASRYRFNSPSGRIALGKIAGHLALRSTDRIWTCNDVDREIFARRLSAGYLRPRQAGTNSYAHVDEAAICYTAKPDQHERRILNSLGIDPAAVVESREYDPIYQFISRTSLRDAASNRDVIAHVYDRVQAETVAAALANRPELAVNLELVDLGFAMDEPERRDLTGMMPEERLTYKREQARMRKRRERERKRT